MLFDFSNGGAVEFRAKTITFSQNHHMNVMCFITNELSKHGACRGENWIPKIGIWIAPPNEAAGPGIHVIYPGHKAGEVVYPYPGDGWHTYRFEICLADYIASIFFYIDGKKFYETDNNKNVLSILAGEGPFHVCVSGRSVYGDNLIDDVRVMLPK